ncbi:hypothetical protein E2I00_013569, partial [Balaenoptera physalus]
GPVWDLETDDHGGSWMASQIDVRMLGGGLPAPARVGSSESCSFAELFPKLLRVHGGAWPHGAVPKAVCVVLSLQKKVCEFARQVSHSPELHPGRVGTSAGEDAKPGSTDTRASLPLRLPSEPRAPRGQAALVLSAGVEQLAGVQVGGGNTTRKVPAHLSLQHACISESPFNWCLGCPRNALAPPSINIEDLEEAPGVNGDRTDCLLIDAAASGDKRRAQSGRSESRKDGDVADAAVPPEQSNTSGKLRKKKRKQKNKKNAAGESSQVSVVVNMSSGDLQENGLEDIDRILERIEDASGCSHPGPPPLSAKKHVLYVEHRHLNPDTELKRYFGARAVLGEQRPRQRQRVYPKCTWLTTPKSAWPRYTKPGATEDGFAAAVQRLTPAPCLLPAERALYSMECAFHPLFSLTSGTCRLDYRRPENRSFYLALYKQMSFLEKRGCPRTALEYCKLILRARSYEYLIRLFQEWEAHRNLSQLPNFAFSVPLAYFLLSQQADLPNQELSSAREKASLLIQQALFMFPGVLMPLLEYCSVRPDAAVAAHRFFGPDAEIRTLHRSKCLRALPRGPCPLSAAPSGQPLAPPGLQHALDAHRLRRAHGAWARGGLTGPTAHSQPPALSQLVSLYLGRSHFLWKEPATMSWLEENVHEVLQAVDAGDPAVEACESRRKVLYQRAPRNIHRHVVLSEIKEAVAALPPDVSTQSVLGYDPLPPLDTIYSYVLEQVVEIG